MSNPSKNKAMSEAVKNIMRRLENSDRPLGIHHKFDSIPAYYKTKYGVQALYHFEMPDSHRLMYTVRRSPDGDDKEALFLELIDHGLYNKRF